ncbi:MAG: hypothetical protein ACYS0G_16040 [Planctomycetota bacterium]
MSEQQATEDAYAFLRRHTRGDLRFEEDFGSLRYVVGPDGRLAAPVAYAMLNAVDTVLFVPEFAEGAMEVQVTLSAFDPEGPEGALADRWRIYHGEPQDIRWAWLDIDAARYGKWVIDGEALRRSNPLAADEARLCRQINQGGREELRRVCRRFAEADVQEPLLVGIDPAGFDVRRRFDVVRVPAATPMGTADLVEQTFRHMVEQSEPS